MNEIAHLGALHTIAQLSVALIGFSGIVVALGDRAIGSWSQAERLQLYALVLPPATALAASFAPELLATEIGSHEEVWRWSNLVLGLLHLANFLPFFIIGLRKGGVTPMQMALSVTGLTAIAAHFLAAAGLVGWLELIFLAGLLQQLGVGLYNFILLMGMCLD
ncbi:hypothetical protein V0U79_06085 [Hyphobacterium sp. HN65]|uniref:EamA domain-containing protein n=1 Tax=Hyphobacterium lacteum TaxID=3116575 RepID=A0ABU7LPX0_9PROT|nr:hypothetical protein [Hyphobacterium sp. HN65]MEE2525928.1 hypothetical protein [Hyphobacterium sp. HN65]